MIKLFPINEVRLNQIVGPPIMKQTDGHSVSEVYDAYKMMFWNMHDLTSKLKAYDMVQWSKYIDHWSRTQGRRFTTSYQRGEILMADLGAMNFGYEFGYTHPVVVLYETLDMLFIIPGSSKKFGQNKSNIVDATRVNDGFNKDTGLLLNQMRWMHKSRVKQTTGNQTSPQVLEKIEKFNLQLNHEYQKEVQQRAKTAKQLRADRYHLTQQIKQQQEEIFNKETEIKRIQSEFGQYKKTIEDGLEKLREQISNEETLELINSFYREIKEAEEVENLSLSVDTDII